MRSNRGKIARMQKDSRCATIRGIKRRIRDRHKCAQIIYGVSKGNCATKKSAYAQTLIRRLR